MHLLCVVWCHDKTMSSIVTILRDHLAIHLDNLHEARPLIDLAKLLLKLVKDGGAIEYFSLVTQVRIL